MRMIWEPMEQWLQYYLVIKFIRNLLMQEQSSKAEIKDGGGVESSPSQVSASLSAIQPTYPTVESQIAFDVSNNQFVLTGHGEQASDGGPRMILINTETSEKKVLDLTALLQVGDYQQEVVQDHLSDDSDSRRARQEQIYSDNQSILRFVKQSKSSKGLEISTSGKNSFFPHIFQGLSVKLTKNQGGSKSSQEQLVLTNMAFSTGLHIWEIIAPICCNNLQIGVQNPITKQEYLTSFKTTTPRVITVCLDLNEKQVKFWLNDRRNTNKSIKLPPVEGNIWIPCIKIDKEKNKVILNPFAREPSDLYEKDFDKKFTRAKYAVAHIQNTVCVTKLPILSQQAREAANFLKEKLKISSQTINAILLPQFPGLEGSQTKDDQSFCFIQFHYYEQMAEFVTKSTGFKVCGPQVISGWILEGTQQEDLIAPLKLITDQINFPSATQDQAIASVRECFEALCTRQEFKSISPQEQNNSLNTIFQSFTDKLICIKDSSAIRTVSRDPTTQEFDLFQSNFSESPFSLDSKVVLKVKSNQLDSLFRDLNWSQILKEPNDLVQGIIVKFYNSLRSTACVSGKYVIFQEALNIGKFFVEIAIQQVRAQLDRLKRQYQNFQTVIPANSLVQRNKPESPLEILASEPFFKDPNLPVDQLYTILGLLYDIQEQIWCHTRSPKATPEVKQFLTTVSRPQSAFNRLGSYLNWGIANASPIQLSQNGFYFKETNALSHFDNQALDISELSSQSLLESGFIQDTLGSSNRHLQSLITENVPLHKTMNYIPANKMFPGHLQDVITSVNNDFVLIGGPQGSANICNTIFTLNTMRTVQFFSSDVKRKREKHLRMLKKIQSRKAAFDEYKNSIYRKSIPFSMLKTEKGEENDQEDFLSKNAVKKKMKVAALVKNQSELGKKKKHAGKKATSKLTAAEMIDELESMDHPSQKTIKQKPITVEQSETKQTVDIPSAADCKVLGYILLSKPAIEKDIEPLLVGCLYFNGKTQKYFLRLRKLMFYTHYIQNFITLDQQSGQQTNRISGKQLIDFQDFKELYEEILNHKDNVVDLYLVFMMAQIQKKDPRKDSKISILTDIAEADIEIDNCFRVLDFTKCSYSICSNQNNIHILLQQESDKQVVIRRYSIDEQPSQAYQFTDISVRCDASGKVEKGERVFQVDDKIVIVNADSYQVLDRINFSVLEETKFDQPITDFSKVTIQNHTCPSRMFSKENLDRFSSVELIPQQEWKLVILNGAEVIKSFPLTKLANDESQLAFGKQKTIKADDFDLSTFEPSDIQQIGSLLESKIVGTIAVENDSCILTSSGLDQSSKLHTHHTWQIVSNSPSKEKTFEVKLPKGSSSHLKQIDIEFSFTKRTTAQVEIPFKMIEQKDLGAPEKSSIKRLPLIVEEVIGAQINDIVQPCYLVNPDADSFSSNYPQPEYIFTHYHGKAFIPREFVVKSRDIRQYNGIPIAQGLIFVSSTLEEIQNTKQFSKFTEKDYKVWHELRSKMPLPYLSNEPVAFFDLGDQQEVIIPYEGASPVKYVKFIPLAFRKKPINFSSKAFHSNQAECQFFGVNGIEAPSKQSNIASHLLVEEKIDCSDLTIPIQGTLIDTLNGSVGEISSVTLSQVRGPKASNSALPITALSSLKSPYLTGVARQTISIKEEHSDSITHIKFKVAPLEHPEWTLSGVSIVFNSYTDSSALFSSEVLQGSKPKLRHYLLDVSQFSKILKQLVDIASSHSAAQSLRASAIQCILNYLHNNRAGKSYQEFVAQFKSATSIENFINDNWLNQTSSLQSLILLYLDKVGLLKENSGLIFKFIQNQLGKLLDGIRDLDQISSLFEILKHCTAEQRAQVQRTMVDILINQITQVQLPLYQTPEYIILRSKLNINKFTFDDFQAKKDKEVSQVVLSNLSSTMINCNFEAFKLNTLYYYNVDFNGSYKVERMKLFFENDSKSLYKVLVRVIVPNKEGKETIWTTKEFDENSWTQVTEKGLKQEVIKYFSSQSEDASKDSNEEFNSDSSDLNSLSLDLAGYTGRFVKIQIELLDTFRSVHKQQSVTQIFIRPEFYGQQVESNADLTESEKKTFKRFLIESPDPKNKLTTTKIGEKEISMYSMENRLSKMNKACLVVLYNGQQTGTGSNKTSPKKVNALSEEISREKLEEKKEKLKMALNNPQKSKNSLRKKIDKYQRLQSNNFTESQPDSGRLSLRYLLNLSELLASQILQGLKHDNEILSGIDWKAAQLSLFKRFTVYEQKNSCPSVAKILKVLITAGIEDKAQFAIDLFSDYLLTPQKFVNQKNILDFIQTMSEVNLSNFISGFSQLFGIDTSKPEDPVSTSEQVGSIIDSLSTRSDSKPQLSVTSILSVFTLLDEMNFNQSSISSVKADSLFLLLIGLVKVCPEVQDSKSPIGLTILLYATQVLNKILGLPGVKAEPIAENCQQSYLSLIVLQMQRRDKQINKNISVLQLKLIKHEPILSGLFGQLLKWYQCKENIKACSIYSLLEEKKKGSGKGLFFKHFVLIFHQYMKMLQKSNNEESMREACKQLGSLTSELLQVLVEEQDQDDYQNNYSIIWTEVYKSLGVLYSLGNTQPESVNLFITQFLKLRPIHQETLYPKLHEENEKQISTLKNTGFIVELLKSFLFQGFASESSIKITYAICDGFLNILLNQRKEPSTVPDKSTMTKFTDLKEIALLLASYLNQFLNYGTFTGVVGASFDSIMKLDLGVALSDLVLSSMHVTANTTALEQFFKNGQEDDVKLFVDSLIQWIFLNKSGHSKSTPAAAKIFNVSASVEAILSLLHVDNSAVSKCLPILMKNVLGVDYKLRDLLTKECINQERAISVQRNVNSLFLSFFKSWVQSDVVAKKFLTELNGFDFLLDRLFSKKAESIGQELDKASGDKADGESEDQEEDNLIMEMVKKKLKNVSGVKAAPKVKELTKTITTSKIGHQMSLMTQQSSLMIPPPTLMKKEGEIVSALTQSHNASESTKDVEQGLTVDDFAKNIKLIWSSDKQKAIQAGYTNAQWNKFKNGQKNRVFNYVISDQKFAYEYVLKFDLTQQVQINDIHIGVLYNWSTFEQDSAYSPLSLILEGGVDEDTVEWSVLLQPLDDDGPRVNSLTAYGVSFIKNQVSSQLPNIEGILDQVGLRKARYLTLKFRKPLMSCLDQSMFVQCVSKTKSYGLSYFSVNGTLLQSTPKIYSYLLETQKENSLEVLSKFFSGEFTEAFEMISEQPAIIEKIKNAFDKLAVLMNSKASLIKPIFLAICSKNKDFGDWIMTNRLLSLDDKVIKKEQISFLGDIISSDHESQLEKLIKLKDFITTKIELIASGSLKISAEQEIIFGRLIKLFNKKMRELAKRVSESDKEWVMNFTVKDLDNAISVISSCDSKKKSFFNAMTSFILILLLSPQPFKNTVITVDDYISKLLSAEEGTLQNLLFCSIIGSTNENAINKILSLNKIDWAVSKLSDSNSTEAEHIQHYQYAQILFNSSKQQKFRDKYRSTLTFTLYDLLKGKDSDTLIMRQGLQKEYVELLVQTIKDLVIGQDEDEGKLTTMLKQDLIKASDIGDIAFINKVIVPILHAEEKIPISISIYDSKNKIQPVQPVYSSTETQAKDTFFLQTKILNQRQKAALDKNFKELAKGAENFSKLQTSGWDLIFEEKQITQQDSSKFRKFVTSVSNKSNLIILVKSKVLDQEVVFGGFSSKAFPALGDTWAHEFDYQVPYSEGNFVLYYQESKELHFQMTQNKPFGYIYTDYEEGGAFSISGDFFLLSWSYEFQNSCGNIYDMKCIEDPAMISFYNSMEIQSIEIWCCNMGAKKVNEGGKMKSEYKRIPSYQSFSPFNFFRENMIFEVGKDTKLSDITKEILGTAKVFIKYPSEDQIEGNLTIGELAKQNQSGDPIIDLFVLKTEEKQADASNSSDPKKTDGSKLELTLKTIEIQTEVVEAPKEEPQLADKPLIASSSQPLLKLFEEQGGILDLIKAAKTAVKMYRNEKIRELWGLWLAEIDSFSQLPLYFSTFCQDRKKEQIIYNLLDGQYDSKEGEQADNDVTAQQDLQIEMVKYSYSIVSQVFKMHDGAKLRDLCLENGTFERFIERIGSLSSEKKRQRIEKSSLRDDNDVVIDKVEKQIMKKDELAGDKKRKGVGYTTGVGQTWNVSAYLKSKEDKSSQAANIVDILKNMIKSKDWQAPILVRDIILESSLLPTLESALRCGSLLEMAKEFDVNMAYLSFLQEFTNHTTLVELLVEIGDEYEPLQKEPIYRLLDKLADLSNIFLGCLTTDSKTTDLQDEQAGKPKKLAAKIVETNTIVKEVLKKQHQIKQQQSLEEILAMPLQEAYYKLLSDLRFEYMNMNVKIGGTSNHVYANELSKAPNPPVTKLVRLAQEIADLSNSLPCDHTNAIFCRVDKERVDYMKCLIMGAAGTPYAHGAFIYDLFFENTYPNGPPKCQLVTTGGQTVRFNPNLYHNGKVCLSLLGTWRGSATENWDAKLSTILQVLLSIQAIIMSNEVYFNEPGYEHEQGTPEGEKKNDGYANIVRYCNIKFAIIEQIKNPPAGFEKVIRRNYYLKKNEILREVKEWVDKSKTMQANYTGLVYDHNYHWAPLISQEGKYAEMMETIYQELKETLDSLQSPFEDEATGAKVERKFSQQLDLELPGSKPAEAKAEKLDDIDVTYDPVSNQEMQMNINDDKVKDRWSRYIGAMGIEAVAKQAEARVLIAGLGPLGIEIAKNVVLAGCKELILYDNLPADNSDLSGQFFLQQSDIEVYKSRAVLCKEKIQQLNMYVKVTVIDGLEKEESVLLDFITAQKDLNVAVITDCLDIIPVKQKLIDLNEACRKNNTAFILANSNGLFSMVFTDFGDEFTVIDKNGEDLHEVMIKNIEWDATREASVVTLLEGFKHKFEDGDQIVIREVLGMNNSVDSSSINGIECTVKIINPTSFTISEDVRKYSKYEGNGIAKQMKVPKVMKFKSYADCEKEEQETGNARFDPNFLISDFEKMDNFRFLHILYQVMIGLDKEKPFEGSPEIDDRLYWHQYLQSELKKQNLPKDLDEKQQKRFDEIALNFALTNFQCSFAPICAYIGGVVSQEVIKAITQKFTPIHQFFYFDVVELMPEHKLLSITNLEEQTKELDNVFSPTIGLSGPDARYASLNNSIGNELVKKIQNTRLFMIGAGAIGCELLKNFAMIGLGSGPKGQIVITDPDVIEVSNLNRQFLFREKHLRKPKSSTAAAAVIQMNPNLKGHISARLDKIHDGTADIYNEEFFKSLDIVTNALDNVQARLYIDGKCVSARVALLDSGTLGPKGHVQVILPFKTESYATQSDPEDNTEIPHCTLKMFPEETLHCVEWAKDLFGNMFTLVPQSFNKLIGEDSSKVVNFYDPQEFAKVKKVIKIVKHQPKIFEDCLKLARKIFQKHFSNDIKQLLHVYPLDKKTKDDRPFWSLPKRPPQPIVFDSSNETHAAMIGSTACLLATIYKIKIPMENPRDKEQRFKMAMISDAEKQPEFVPNDAKASSIASQVDKEANKDKEEEKEASEEAPVATQVQKIEEVRSLFETLIKPLQQLNTEQNPVSMVVQEFEKDADENFHIDFIHAMANVRAANYKLEEMDWINVKIKAGRIVPALATTTAAIAGLQTIELIKFLKGCKIEEHRNSFLNLAVPSMMSSEPLAPPKTKLKEGLDVTLWDRWEFVGTKDKEYLQDVIDHFQAKFGLEVRDIFFGSVPIYMHALQGKDTAARTKILSQTTVAELTDAKGEFVDMVFTFVDPEGKKEVDGQEQILKGVPPIRIFLKAFQKQ